MGAGEKRNVKNARGQKNAPGGGQQNVREAKTTRNRKDDEREKGFDIVWGGRGEGGGGLGDIK